MAGFFDEKKEEHTGKKSSESKREKGSDINITNYISFTCLTYIFIIHKYINIFLAYL